MHGFLLRWWVIAAKYLVPVLLWRTWTYTGPVVQVLNKKFSLETELLFEIRRE